MSKKYGEAEARRVFWSRIEKRKNNDCWPWSAGSFTDGYGCSKYKGKVIGAHRLVWMFARGRIPNGMCVLHRCDNPSCCNPRHLFLGTKADNNEDKRRKGRAVGTPGEKQAQSKLTPANIRRIRKLYIPWKYGAPRLAKQFNIAQSMIWRIIHGKNWSHIV